jgi:nucleotide-binding universal stress UspA family protein
MTARGALLFFEHRCEDFEHRYLRMKSPRTATGGETHLSRGTTTGMFENILFPVDFSPSCAAMAAYVQRAEAILGSKVSLLHVVDLTSFNSFELYTRPLPEITQEHLNICRERLDSFLSAEFPISRSPRIVTSGDAATEIAQTARGGRFDLIIMPTHSGYFRQMLLGSTTAKVINDADCPVLTSRHAETIAPRPLDHREWLCSIGLSSNSERVLRFASQAAATAQARLTIIHAVQSGDPDLPVKLEMQDQIDSVESHEARQGIARLQERVRSQASIRIAVGSVKEALIEAARQSDADVLMIGRSPRSGAHGRMRDLTYSMVRDSPYPVVSI